MYKLNPTVTKLKDVGAEALNNEELVRVFCDLTLKNKSTPEIKNFWQRVPDLAYYRILSVKEQLAIFGKNDSAAAMVLMAAVELGRRIQSLPTNILGQVEGSQQLGQTLIARFQKQTQEQLWLLCLDTKNRIKWEKLVFQGGLNSAAVHPREIMVEVLRVSSNGFIMVHNHPSGIAEPSIHDLEFTKRMVKVGKLLGIELIDHLIIGDQNYWSAAEKRLIN